VLGCHRSATSLIAAGLHSVGVTMGTDLIGGGPSNPAGHYEDRAFVRLNNRLLTMAGGVWFAPPPEGAVKTAGIALDSRLADYLTGRETGGSWGVKDPRLCITWPAWLPHLRRIDDLIVVPVWRRPDEIARSLTARERRPTPPTPTYPTAPTTWTELAHEHHRRMADAVATLTQGAQ